MSLTGVEQLQAEGMPRHAAWYHVLKPTLVKMPNGQPGYEIVHSAQTIEEASMHGARVPGSVVVLNFVVLTFPKTVAAASSFIASGRKQ
jgi:hypothetical protein